MTACRYPLQRCPITSGHLPVLQRAGATPLRDSIKAYPAGLVCRWERLSCPPLCTPTMAGIHITDIEAAINFWRERKPSPDGVTLAPELRALAEVYALMVFYREEEANERGFPPAAYAAWKVWYDTTPDTPCIAICSTSQGDET